jgi:hypothetical protein
VRMKQNHFTGGYQTTALSLFLSEGPAGSARI